MTEDPDPHDAEQDRLMGEADVLIRSRRGQLAEPGARPGATLASGNDRIPLLTDLVSPGRLRAHAPDEEALEPETASRSPLPSPDAGEAEREIVQELEPHFRAELAELVERRVVERLSASVDDALVEVARELKPRIEQWVADAVRRSLGVDSDRHLGNQGRAPEDR